MLQEKIELIFVCSGIYKVKYHEINDRTIKTSFDKPGKIFKRHTNVPKLQGQCRLG